MIDYPKWKLALIAVVMMFAVLYAAPNIFPQDPAVQVSANRGKEIDDALKARVRNILESKSIAAKGIEIGADRLLVRLENSTDQINASEVLRNELGDGYVAALNLASTVPDWLSWFGAKGMSLGLDLRGGVHFLMEVDQEETIRKQEERYVEDLRGILRDAQVRYKNVARGAQGIVIQLVTAEARDAAYEAITSVSPELVLSDGPVGEETVVIIATIPESTIRQSLTNALEQNVSTLRSRINELGVAEPIIQQQGDSRIVVQLPGVQDTALAKKILGATATLEYRAQDMKGDVMAAIGGRAPPESRIFYRRDGSPVLLSKRVIVSGDQLNKATAMFDQQSGEPGVSVELNNAGARRMEDFTRDNVGNGMAVVFIESIPEIKMVDGKQVITRKVKEEVISVANVREPFGKRFQTTGLESSKEATTLALLLNAGSLAAPVTIIEERIIGPSLGAKNIERGFNAVMAGFIIVAIWITFYYRWFGLIGISGLVANLVLLTALLSILGATLTMPGIAGILLTLGMAIDANVLIAERIREEIRNGGTPIASIKSGYEKAWATIADANITTLLAGIALLAFGSGPIRGFAVVLCIGILTSMFTAVTVTYAIAYLSFCRSGKRIKKLSIGV